MSEGLGTSSKKEIIKDIIRKLHEGLSVAEAKERFEKEAGTVTSAEIADIEQSLISEGMAPEEIKRFCNVHALLFESELKAIAAQENAPEHPVSLFKRENREIEKRTAALKALRDRAADRGVEESRAAVRELLGELKGINVHYERKEQLLFPYLEKHGFPGPSKVMWGKDNEIRELLKKALGGIDAVTPASWNAWARDVLAPLIEEVDGMIFKEENILFPTSLEKLSADEWATIITQSPMVGFVFGQGPSGPLADRDLLAAQAEKPSLESTTVNLGTGSLELRELLPLLNTLPVDVTFVDKDDKVKYFSASKDRIFVRTPSVLGRSVQNCHPPQSLHAVEKILDAFKAGLKDHFDFWLNLKGRFVSIRYFAIRDEKGGYLGTLEVTQDIGPLRNLTGEKRLIDEKDYYR